MQLLFLYFNGNFYNFFHQIAFMSCDLVDLKPIRYYYYSEQVRT